MFSSLSDSFPSKVSGQLSQFPQMHLHPYFSLHLCSNLRKSISASCFPRKLSHQLVHRFSFKVSDTNTDLQMRIRIIKVPVVIV